MNMKNSQRIIRYCSILLMAVFLLGGCAKKKDGGNLAKAMEALDQNDYTAAMENFEKALLNKEDSQLTYRGMGIAYMGLGNYAEAETAFLTSSSFAVGQLTDLDYDTNYYLASAYIKQKKYAEAEEIYTAIISLRKKDLDAYYLRGCVYLKQNNYQAAIKDFEKAFSLAPNNIKLVTDAYVEMRAAGFEEEGRAYLNDLMKKKEKSMKNEDKGRIYFYLEDYENARINLDAFVEGKDAELSLLLGQTYEKLNDMKYAVDVYETYLNSNPPNAAIYNGLGTCLMRQGNYEDAIAAFQSGIDIGDARYMQELKFNLIVATEYMGNFSQAKTLMQEYLQLYPDDAKAKRESNFLSTR